MESLITELTTTKKRLKEATCLKVTQINKDAMIQRFKLCFELAWKTIQAYVRDQGLEGKSPKSCLRIATDLGLIENLEDWFGYLEARNLIAHTYNEELADKVYKTAVKFPAEINKLLKNIK